MADKQSSMTPVREDRTVGRTRSQEWGGGPFRSLQRFADEVDRMFDDFGLARRWRGWPGWTGENADAWAPQIDVFQKGDQLVIKADLPGLSKDDVHVDVTEDAITIQGERKSEREDRREGYYQTERSYGSFARVIPLPTGAMGDQAKATFHDGVLEVTMPCPPAASRGRRLDISEGAQK